MSQSRPRLPDGQKPLIACMKSSGHTSFNDGVCHGVAYKGMFSILSETLDGFDETVELIYQSQGDFSLVNANTKATALLDCVTIFQYPDFHSELLTPNQINITQENSNRHLLPLFLPHELEETGGIAMISKITGAGAELSLNAYFASLAEIINKTDITKPIALVFGNSDHSITLGYLPKQKQWVLINANSLPCEYIGADRQDFLAKKVMDALMYSNKTAVFSVKIFVNNNTRQEYKKCMKKWKSRKEWKAIHIPNERTCHYKNDEQVTWLHMAAKMGLTEQAKLLIECGAEINKMKRNGTSTLLLAAKEGNVDTVKLLLKNNADADLGNCNNETALHVAAEHGSEELLTWLMTHGATPDLATNQGLTAMHFAACNGRSNLIRLLQQYGTDVNKRTKEGATPLFLAAQYGDDEMVEALLNNGADPSLALNQSADHYKNFARGIDQKTVERMNQFLIAEFNNSSIQRNSTSVSGFIRWSFFNTVNSNMPRMLSIENYYQMTPVQIAEIMGYEEIVNLLKAHHTARVTI